MACLTRKLALTSIVSLSACSGNLPSSTPAVFGVQARAIARVVYVAEACAPGSTSCSPPNGLVQRLGGAAITDRVANPVALAFDKSGNLYVSNSTAGRPGNITVYAAGSGRLLRTIAGYRGVSYALAVSPSQELFVVSHYKYKCCNFKGSVAVYARDATLPARRLFGVGSFPGKPAFDAAGNFYQPNFDNFPGWINVYASGATKPFRSITKGVGFPLQIAFDSQSRAYVLNGLFGGGTDVMVYAQGSNVVLRTIKSGAGNASAIAIGPHDNLYVANRGDRKVPASVTVYEPARFKPVRTIERGIDNPIALGFDRDGNLYVANAAIKGASSVSVYAPHAASPKQTYPLKEPVMALVAGD